MCVCIYIYTYTNVGFFLHHKDIIYVVLHLQLDDFIYSERLVDDLFVSHATNLLFRRDARERGFCARSARLIIEQCAKRDLKQVHTHTTPPCNHPFTGSHRAW